MRAFSVLCFAAFSLSASLAHADALYTFESVSDGTGLPLSLTSDAITATFTGQASVCDTSMLFATLGGKTLVQGVCGSDNGTGPLQIAFSSDIKGLSFNFATAGDEDDVTVQLFTGNALTAVETFRSSFPADPDYGNGEGFAQLAGNFDAVSISSASPLAIDNVDAATPEPSSLLLLGTGLLGAVGLRRRLA